MSGILPTRGHMIDFLVNLAPNLNPKTHQKSNQEAPKIDKEGYSKHDASWLRIWNPLGRHVGTQNPPKICPEGFQKVMMF